LDLVFRQTNHEGQLVDWVQEAREHASGIVINPAGYSFTSVALLDALKASELPVVEVHITNIHRRESIYHKSLVSLAAMGVICGLGPLGYELALTALAERLKSAA
jgi:3-dehydroquinate dehydratase-2